MTYSTVRTRKYRLFLVFPFRRITRRAGLRLQGLLSDPYSNPDSPCPLLKSADTIAVCKLGKRIAGASSSY